MSLLVGLPLKLFALLFGLLRFLWLPLLIWLLVLLVRRLRRQGGASGQNSSEPHFDGPVVEVEFRDVTEPEEEQHDL